MYYMNIDIYVYIPVWGFLHRTTSRYLYMYIYICIYTHIY